MACSKFLSYEETVPGLRATYFPDFYIHTRENVSGLIAILPDDPYSEMPETYDPKPTANKKGGRPMTPKEMQKLNKHAQILIMSDERKASGIANYVKTELKMDLQEVPNTGPKSCGYSAVLQQISNTEYTYDQETGEEYGPDHLRVQLIHFMAVNCDTVYPELLRLNLLPTSYKDWLYQQLDPETQIDESALLGLRLMLKVSNHLIVF